MNKSHTGINCTVIEREISEDGRTETLIYAPQVPTGTARTRGHGTTRNVYVLRAPVGFKTIRSKHSVRRFIGTARFDYGTKTGRAAALVEKAREVFAMLALPDARTTREEF